MFQFFIDLFLILWYTLKSWVLFFIPRAWRLKSVAGEIVLITGGGSGLGRMLSLKFAKREVAHIVIWDINKAGLDETVALVEKLGAKISSYVCDITDRHAVYETAERVRQEVGAVTILINNAGVVSGKKLMHTPDEKILLTMNVNIMSHFWMVKAFLPDMMNKNHGHLVSIASSAGLVGVPMMVDYCASKYAAVGK